MTFKTKVLALASLLTITLSLSGCGGSNDGNPIKEGDKVAISSSNKNDVTHETISLLSLGESSKPPKTYSTSSHSKVTLPLIQQPYSLIPSYLLSSSDDIHTQLGATQTEQCYDGGSITITSDGSESGTIVYNNCEMGDVTINGKVFVASTNQDSATVTFTDYSLKSPDGEIVWESAEYDYRAQNNNFVMSITMTGHITTEGVRTDFINYKTKITINNYNNSYADNYSISLALSGLVKTDCLGGWIEISTPIPVVVQDTSCPIQGKIVVKGNNSEYILQFNADESADITVNGSKTHYNNCNEIDDKGSSCSRS